MAKRNQPPKGRPGGGLTIEDQVRLTTQDYGRLDSSVLELTLLLYRTMAEFDRATLEEPAPVCLSISQFSVLSVLNRSQAPLTMGQLSDSISVRPTNLTGIVAALVERKFVLRTTNPVDRRSALL